SLAGMENQRVRKHFGNGVQLNVCSCGRHTRHTKNKSPSCCRSSGKMAEKRCGASERNKARGESRSETYKSVRHSDERCVRFWPQNPYKNVSSCATICERSVLQAERRLIANGLQNRPKQETSPRLASCVAFSIVKNERCMSVRRDSGRRRPPSRVLRTRDAILCSTLSPT